MLVTDFDKDGKEDIVSVSKNRQELWLTRKEMHFHKPIWHTQKLYSKAN